MHLLGIESNGQDICKQVYCLLLRMHSFYISYTSSLYFFLIFVIDRLGCFEDTINRFDFCSIKSFDYQLVINAFQEIKWSLQNKNSISRFLLWPKYIFDALRQRSIAITTITMTIIKWCHPTKIDQMHTWRFIILRMMK